MNQDQDLAWMMQVKKSVSTVGLANSDGAMSSITPQVQKALRSTLIQVDGGSRGETGRERAQVFAH